MQSSLVEETNRDIALHATDFVPLGAQIHVLQFDIDELEKSLHSLISPKSTSDALRLEKHRALRLALSDLCAVKRALLSPWRKLPPEILGEIFVWCIPDFSDTSVIYNSTTPESAPLLLVRVCKKWERVAINTPQLWCKLGLHGIRGSNPLALISTWLSRSGSLPIDVYINPLTWHSSVYSNSFNTTIVPKTMQMLSKEFHRCRTFHSSNLPALLEGLFPDGSHIHAPLLKDFQITPSPKVLGYTLACNLTAPNLETIDVCDPFQTLRSITMNHENIRYMRWNGSCSLNLQNASLDNLASLLRSCPNLEECEIVRPTSAVFFDSSTKVHLPRLRRLSLILKCSVELEDFLSLLDLPVLGSLRLEVDPTRHTRPTLKQTLGALFPSSSPPPLLKELHVVHLDIVKHGGAYDPAQPLVFPNLETLSFKDCTLHSAFLESLTPEYDHPLDSWKLPRLSSLHLSNVEFDGAHLVHMVENRIRSSFVQPSRFKLISSWSCRGITQIHRAALGALAEVHEGFSFEERIGSRLSGTQAY